MLPTRTHDDIRRFFPALEQSEIVFLDNAGGSQMPGVVADAMNHYLRHRFVQTGADYATSREATATVARAHEFLRVFTNAGPGSAGHRDGARDGTGEAIIGASTSALCRMLADCYAEVLTPGGEIVVCETAHESNLGPWARLERFGHTVRVWRVDPATGEAPLGSLLGLLTPKTRIVAFPQVSNILGEIVDVPGIVRAIRGSCGPADADPNKGGPRIVVDGVAAAPHRAIDAAALGCDYYVYSTYKVFGPHAAAMFARRDALAALTGPNHAFIPKDEHPRKFELGGANHESCAGILALDDYLRDLLGRPRLPDPLNPAHAFDRRVVTDGFAAMESLESVLQDQFMGWLRSQSRLRVVGPARSDASRVCTISFVHESRPSKQIAQAANAAGLGIRYGNFYAVRLCRALGLDLADGVVRVSFAHYNSPREVDRLIAGLHAII